MAPSTAQPNAYLRTKVLTASPAELRLMLFDGAIKFAEQGRAGLEQRDHEAAFIGITRCQNIIMELINGLKPEREPDLCEKLASLYTYLYTRLMAASSERRPELLNEVIDLLRYERETWSMVIERLAPDPLAAAAAGRVEQVTESRAGSLSVTG